MWQTPPKDQPLPLRSCLELGLCQARTPACAGCCAIAGTKDIDATTAEQHAALAASVQASRNTGCCSVLGLDEHDFRESLTPFERIAYWGAVGFAVGLGLVAVFGVAGYASVKVWGL